MSSKTTIAFLRKNWFPLAMAIIAGVSLFDTYLIYHYRGEIGQLEENPIGYWLLQLDRGNVGIFVRTKLAGTVCVLSTLAGMWVCRSRLVFPVTTSVASYQVGLLAYLILA